MCSVCRGVGTAWLGFFAVFLSLSLVLGIVPQIDYASDVEDEKENDVVLTSGVVTPSLAQASEPVRVIIDSVGVDSVITTPSSTAINVLDEALLDGVVHYPGSAKLGESGNVFLFGHSTSFRVVSNQAYKVFNNIKDLSKNDTIRLQSGSDEHVYRVTSVRLVNADEALVDLSATGRKLTLSTCNTFGAKQERYVVEAEFVGSYAL